MVGQESLRMEKRANRRKRTISGRQQYYEVSRARRASSRCLQSSNKGIRKSGTY